MIQQELFKLTYISYQQWLKKIYDEALQQIQAKKIKKGGNEK